MKRTSRSPRAHKRNVFIKRFPTTLKTLFTNYQKFQQVLVKIDSSVHKGQPCPRVANRTGTVLEVLSTKTIDKVYKVKIDKKTYNIYSAHLRLCKTIN